MNVAIIGSRSFKDFDLLEKYISYNIDIKNISTIISGGAIGTDHLAEVFAKKYKNSY
jgi:hypothetical protein